LHASVLHTPQKLLAHHLPLLLPSPATSRSRFHVLSSSTIYDVLEQASIQVTSPPLSCYLFSYQDTQEVVWEMRTNKVTDEEGFQAELFKHDLHALDYHLVDLFNHIVYTGFPQA